MSPQLLDHSVSAPVMPERQADHADDLELGAHPREHPGEQLEQQAHQGPEDEDRQIEAAIRQSTPWRCQSEVQDERGDGGDGAVGEVEDAGGLVREHEPGAREAVDGPGGQTDDDKRKQIVHAADTPHFVCRTARGRRDGNPKPRPRGSRIARVVHRTVTAGGAPVNRACLAARINRVH